MTFLWGQMIKSIYEKAWHIRQWVPWSLVSSERLANLADSRWPLAQSAIEEPDSRLLSLPGEICNSIWRFTVLQESPLNVINADHCPVFLANKYHHHGAPSLRWTLRPAEPPAGLLGTCRQSRKEVLPIYYAENVFSVTLDTRQSLEASQKWLHALSDDGSTHLRGIYLQCLVLEDRRPLTYEGFPASSMSVYVDFEVLRAYLEVTATNQSKEMRVIEHTLIRCGTRMMQGCE